MLLSSIHSPSTGVLHIGPVSLHAYGLAIAAGVVAAVWLANKRWVARDGNSDDITALATWGVPAGIVGARIYHVITDYQRYTNHPLKAFAIWDGGLGIWGGIAAGVGMGLVVARRRRLPLLVIMDVVAPALALGQAIGRWGNYFNQELFGKPTTLPWGLSIDSANRPDGYARFSTFHPTFLYESISDLLLCGLLLLLERRWKLGPGRLFGLYVMGYTFARFFIEHLRIDPSHHIAGLRLNDWTALVVFLATGLILAGAYWRSSRSESISEVSQ